MSASPPRPLDNVRLTLRQRAEAVALRNVAGTAFWAQLAALAVPEDNAQRAM